jgi:galactokinase
MPVLVIANSNVKHDLGAGEYPIRVRQCNDATEALSTVNSLIKSLRDASMDDIDAASASGALAGVLLRRARHVISENARTLNAADAWVSGDWESVGKLMNESHSSMKDDFEVSCDEIDILVQLAQNFHGVYGSRLTGGGFGGCTVTLVKRNAAQGLIDCLNKEYEVKTGTKCDCFVTSPADGAMAINV